MIATIDKLEALLAGVAKPDLERAPPAQRRRLAQALRHVADLCDPPARTDLPKSAVLATLREGPRTG